MTLEPLLHSSQLRIYRHLDKYIKVPLYYFIEVHFHNQKNQVYFINYKLQLCKLFSILLLHLMF